MKRILLAALCGGALLASTATAFAEPIKFVVPFAAGGPVDQTARILTNELGPKLGEDIIVDDRGGAGGAIAGEFVARSAPDGKTVLFGSFGAFVLGPILKPPANYDPVKSFEPVMLVGKVPSLVVVNKDSDISTLADLIAKAKKQKLSYGSAGPGTTMNIAIEMLNNAAGIKINHVPYRGAAPAITDLLGDHIDTMNADLPVLMPLAKSGTVKALALFALRPGAANAGPADNQRTRLSDRDHGKLVRRIPPGRHTAANSRPAGKSTAGGRRHANHCPAACRQRHPRHARTRSVRS